MNKKIYLGIIYSVTAVCMIVGIIINVLSISSKGYTIFGHSRNTVTYDEDLSSFDTLDIDMSFGNIYIKKGTSFHVSYTGNKNYIPEYSISGNKLTIEQKNIRHSLINVGFSNTKSELTITIPSDITLESLWLDINAGNVSIADIKSSIINADIDMGNLEISGCEFNTYSSDINMGNLDISGCEFDTCKGDVNMGNAKISQCSFNNISLSVDMGNATIKPVTSDKYGYNLTTDLGNITVFGADSKHNYSNNTTSHNMITIDVNMGNIDIL